MRAAVVGADGIFEIVTVPDPSPGPGELVLRVTACGLCGSDVKARPAMPAGTIMGHEFGGAVVAAGPGTHGWPEGTQVAVLPVLPCGTCPWCASGLVAHCPSARLIGLGGSDGGFAEYTVVTPLAAFTVPPRVDPLHSALVEPFAVGLHNLHTAGAVEGLDVLVVGAGTVGLTSIAWARELGGRRITVVDPVAARRTSAAMFGATDALASLDDATPSGYDVVLECVGKGALLDGCIAAARTKGRIVVAGVAIEPAPFSSVAALMKELTIGFAVYYTPVEFRAVVEAFTTGRIDPAPLVAHRVDLARVNDAFDDVMNAAAGGKILVEP
jgi:(R,R)-butanediol dehydrogenase / meso-butanediol dehydrogenase / diacetyl reductase